MQTVKSVQREIDRIKQHTGAGGKGVTVTMWCPDNGSGESGFARFNTKKPMEKTPLTKKEVEQLFQGTKYSNSVAVHP